MFTLKQIVWAKVRGFPWWPAEITKLSVNQGPYKVVFIGQNNHAFLNYKQVKKYQQNYADLSQKKYKGLPASIQKANQILQKRKTQLLIPSKISKQQPIQVKTKIIMKRGRHKLRGRKPKPKQILQQPSLSSQENIQEIKQQETPQKRVIQNHQKKIKAVSAPVLKRKYSKKVAKQSESSSISIQIQQKQENIDERHNQKQQSDMDSQMQHGWSQIQGQLQNNAIDRSRINAICERLFDIVTRINNQQYNSELKYFKSINWQQISGQELSQSRITNMLSYIVKKATELSLKKITYFSAEQKQFIQVLNLSLKARIVQYLFDTNYYDQYLKLVQKNQTHQNEYQNSLKHYLRKNYKLKKQFCQIFAQFVNKEILQGNITKEKQLLADLRDKTVQIIPFNNKAALQRSVQSLLRIYT